MTIADFAFSGTTHSPRGDWLQRVTDDRSRLIRIVGRLARDREEAEEVVQEAIVRAWSKGRETNEQRSARGWVIGIARNIVLDRRRSRGRRREFAQPDPTTPMPSSRAVSPSLHMRNREEAARLNRAIESLPAPGREVIRLRHEDGLAFTLIARRLSIQEQAARKRYSRALAALREALA